MNSKALILLVFLTTIYLQSFSQQSTIDSVILKNDIISPEQIKKEKQSQNGEVLTSKDLPKNMFYAGAGVDLHATRFSLSYNYLFASSHSLGVEYRMWFIPNNTLNVLTFDFRKYNLTPKNNLSSFGIDLGFTFGSEQGLYNTYLVFSPNYLYGFKISQNLFFTFKANFDVMYNPEYKNTILNPGVSIGLLF
jgi:hypothetical protein